MATIINNPAPNTNSAPPAENSSFSWIVAALIFLLAIILLIFFGLPALRQVVSVPQINVPGQIDINVNQPGE